MAALVNTTTAQMVAGQFMCKCVQPEKTERAAPAAHQSHVHDAKGLVIVGRVKPIGRCYVNTI